MISDEQIKEAERDGQSGRSTDRNYALMALGTGWLQRMPRLRELLPAETRPYMSEAECREIIELIHGKGNG